MTGITHQSHLRNGFHIRKCIDPEDVDAWTMTIPSNLPRALRGYEDRTLLVKGPSREHWLRDHEMYHQKLTCNATKGIHSAMELEIDQDEHRQYKYWYIICPEDIMLDNRVFSDDDEHVMRYEVAMKIEASANDFDVDIHGLAIYWQVGEAGGQRVQSTKKEVDKKNLFS